MLYLLEKLINLKFNIVKVNEVKSTYTGKANISLKRIEYK